MFIRENDFKYLEGLYKGLDEERQKKLLQILLKAGSRRSGEEDIKKIQVVDDESVLPASLREKIKSKS